MAFTIRANDGAALSATAVTVPIRVSPVNDAPTFTTFTSPLTGLGSEDSEIVISYTALKDAGNEADIDSSTINFKIIALTSGTLAIRPSGTTGVGTPATGETIDSTEELLWRPAVNASGDQQAFTIKAIDGEGRESSTALQVTINLTNVNDPPSLGNVATLTAAGGGALGTEDSDIVIGYTTLKNAADESDPDAGDTINFRIAAVSSGLLGIRTAGSVVVAVPVVPGVTVLASTQELVWRPALNANGDLAAFTVTAIDAANIPSSTAVQVTVKVGNDNDAPTLTAISTLTGTGGTVPLGNEDSGIIISYAGLKAAADEADIDGDTVDFQVVALTAGTLVIRNAGSTDAGSAAVGQTLTNGKELLWRPAANANGVLPAFTVRASAASQFSATAVQVSILVAALNDAPTLTTVTTLTGAGGVALGNEESDLIITYALLQAAADEADIDGDTVDFQVMGVSSGTLAIRAAGSGTVGTPALNQRFSSAQELVWRPADNASGNLAAFTVQALDATNLSGTSIQVTVSVAATNDPPTLTTITSLSGGNEDTDLIIRRGDVISRANEDDVDGDTVDFLIVGGITGSLGVRAINTVVAPTAVVAGVTILTAANELVWRPAENANGLLTVCTLVAHAIDGDSAVVVPLQAEVAVANDAIVTTPATVAINYSLSISGYAQILPDTVAVVDPDGEPTLRDGGNRLTITARVVNQIQGEDAMVVRNTVECALEQDGSNYRILRRVSPRTEIAYATFSNGLLTITTRDGADTVATDGTPPPGRNAIVAWLLKTIAYTNLAGRFANETEATRSVEIQVVEGWPTSMPGGQTPAVITALITHQRSNEPPSGVVFAPLSVSPGGTGVIELSTLTGAVPVGDDQTPNDLLAYTLIGTPQNGRLIDLTTRAAITSFTGSRWNSTNPQRVSGIGYENTNPNASADGISFQVTDAGGLTFIANVAIRITFGTGEARIVSDPLLIITGAGAVTHRLQLVGPTGSAVTLSVDALPGFPGPGAAVAIPADPITTSSDGNAVADLIITPPAQSDYLIFLVTCTIGNSTTRQPFIIRLVAPIASVNGIN